MFRLLIALVFLVAPGCSFFAGAEGVEPNYASDAEQNLRLGQAALTNRNYNEAAKYFEHVRSKFPFLDAANEAELGLADADFGKEQFAEARERYEGFVKLHPTHSKVQYAAYRAALTHYREIPSDFFILPPSFEKEQTEVQAAQKAFQDFLRDHPRSEFQTEIETLAADVRMRLARHELYVADFYERRGRWAAVAGRLQTLVDAYPGTPLEPSALLRLHGVYVRLGKPDQAREALRRLAEQHPNSSEAKRARELLAKSPS